MNEIQRRLLDSDLLKITSDDIIAVRDKLRRDFWEKLKKRLEKEIDGIWRFGYAGSKHSSPDRLLNAKYTHLINDDEKYQLVISKNKKEERFSFGIEISNWNEVLIGIQSFQDYTDHFSQKKIMNEFEQWKRGEMSFYTKWWIIKDFHAIERDSRLKDKRLWREFYHDRFNYIFRKDINIIVDEAFNMAKEIFEAWKEICQRNGNTIFLQ